MVSDTDIARRVASLLRKADLTTTTPGVVRKQLEQEFGVDLTDRKAFIREQIDLYLRKHREQEEEEERGREVEESLEEGEGGVEDGEDEDQDQEEEEEEEEEKPTRRTRQPESEPDSKRLKAKIDRAIKASLPKEKKKRAGGGGGGLNKVCSLSPELQAIIGEAALPRTQVVKLLWVYIRENELQDPDNKRKILCNDELRGLFGVDSTDIFKMNKLLSRHIWPLDKPAAVGDEDRKVKKLKVEKSANERPKADRKDGDKVKTEKKDSGRGRGTGLSPLSEKLIEFLGTDETEMAQHDVVKHIWDYIGEHKLQDAADRRTIICDEKLQDLFGCDTFVGFGLTKLLAPHLKG